MSFSSGSSKGNHYRNGHNGSNHYKKKGLLGNFFNMISSRSGSQRNRNNYQNNNIPRQNQPIANQNSISCSKCNS